MKKFMSVVLTLCMVLSLLPAVSGGAAASTATSGTCGDHLTWTLNANGQLTISGTGNMADYIYGTSPFYDRDDIKTAVVSSGVTSIGGYAFDVCSSLTSVTIPSGVTSVGWGAFYGCKSLTNVTIPSGVTSIEAAAFGSCSSLTKIAVDSENKNYSSVDGILFNKAKTTLMQYPAGKNDAQYSISSGVTSIGGEAFIGCSSLTSVTIPSSVTSIGTEAFYHCRSLTSVTISSGVTSIRDQAFRDCRSLKSVAIPSGVTSIEYSTFKDCNSLTSVTIPSSMTSIRDSAFEYCYSLTSVTIPFSVTSIGDSAFKNCSSLTRVTIPSGVTSIGESAFQYCSSLTSAYFQGNATASFGYGVFYNCASDFTIYYPTGASGWSTPTWNGYKTSTGTVPVTNNTYSDVSFSYRATEGDNDKTYTGLTYKDEWLIEDSYTYNHELAKMSLGLAMAGFGSHTENKDCNIRLLYAVLGFNEKTYKSIGYNEEDQGTVAMAIDSKSVIASDGSVVPLVAVTLRGGDYGGGGWAGNYEVGDSGAYHNGFAEAAVNARAQIKQYLSDHNYSASDVHIWLTGYSRSAATANLLSQLIRCAGLCKKENIYTYTFATPSNQKIAYFNGKYSNIFNITNPLDIVPMVPPVDWNIGKDGTTYQLPCIQTASPELYDNFTERFKDITGTEYKSKTMQRIMVADLLSMITDSFETRTKYSAYIQNALVKMKQGDNSGIDDIFCGKTTVSEITQLLENHSYAKLTLKVKTAYDYRKKTWGEDDPYITMLDRLKNVCVYAAYENINGQPGYNTDMCDFLLDIIQNKFSSAALQQHWPEVYLAWMSLCSGADMNKTDNYRIARVSCPVDVVVYDAENKIVAKTKTVTFTDDGNTYTISVIDKDNTTIDAAVIGEDKMFALPSGGTYRTAIVKNDTYQDGDTMDVSITDYTEGAAVRETRFDSVSLAGTASFSAAVDANSTETQNYTLSGDNKVIEPSAVTNLAEKDVNGITDVDVGLEEDGCYHISGQLPTFNESVTVLYALYDSNGRLLEIQSQIVASDSTDRTLTGKLKAHDSASRIKIFALSTSEKTKPLNASAEINLT